MIGDLLRKEREKQKLSVRDIEQATSIRSAYIEALEKGEYDKLPGEVYAKGFIKNYGNFLNLDGEELVRQFIMEISSVANVQDESSTANNNLKSEDQIVAKYVGTKTESVSKDIYHEESNSKKFIFSAVAAVLILIGGFFYSSNTSESKEVAKAPQIEKPKVEEVEKTVQPEPIQVATVEPPPVAPPPPPPIEGLALQATFEGDCWTRVTIDGAMIFEGMINAGQTFDWKANQSVSVLLGNAGAVQFVKNGQSVGALGAYGDVVEETFTL